MPCAAAARSSVGMIRLRLLTPSAVSIAPVPSSRIAAAAPNTAVAAAVHPANLPMVAPT
jgi:hypothetical protein